MKPRSKLKILLILTAVLAIAVYSATSASGILVNKGKDYFESEISSACYFAIGKILSDESVFDGLFDIKTDVEGNIVFISTDSLKLNLLATRLANLTYEKFCECVVEGFEIPFGAFTGITLLSGTGPNVKIKLVNVKSVKCEFYTTFSSVGINQTRQSLYLKIVPDASITLPYKTCNIGGVISVLCYENVIVGKVPDCYLNGNTFFSTAN